MSGILSAICTNYAISSAFPSTVKVLVVGGGGGGGAEPGGGGGAGGLVYDSAYSITDNTSYPVTVGAGGDGCPSLSGSELATDGGDSVFGTITAYGGGHGVWRGGSTAGSGGCGGGAGGACTFGTGSQGGNGGTYSLNPYSAGGGGGAGGNGGNANGNAGVGGIGIENDISGTPTYYAGGGAGGPDFYRGGQGASGGLGGGGSSSNGVGGGAGTNGLGGGGAGGSNGNPGPGPGGAGGSGVVIISYVGSAIATGGTITSSGGNTIHTFTSSGNFIVGTPLIPTDGLVNEWLLHSDANDSVGSANLTSSGLTFGTTGGKASATYATNAYARKTSFTFPSNFTVSFWIYLDDTNDTQYLFKGDGGAPSVYIALRGAEPTSLRISYNNNSGDRDVSYPRASLSTGTWVNITMTNQENGASVSFINGAQYATASTGAGSAYTALNLNVGGYDTNGGNNPHGSMRDCRIWNRVLTQQEITDIYNVG